MGIEPLSKTAIDRFVVDGFARLDEAFTVEQAEAASAVLLQLAGVDADEPATWPGPVRRVQSTSDPAVTATITTPRLAAALDQLIGRGQWQSRRAGFGTFPIRFPSDADPGDAGWHIDGSFGQPPLYQVEFCSLGRALLLLMLFTEVGPLDAPTRIRVGSHLPVARALRRIDRQITFLPERYAPEVLDLPIELATGAPGTVYLCHPFLVHAATWPHRGTRPRILAQPAIHHPEGPSLGSFDYDAPPDSPVKRAVRLALQQAG